MSGIIEWAFGKKQTPAERLRKVFTTPGLWRCPEEAAVPRKMRLR
jgi:hypothetical protein